MTNKRCSNCILSTTVKNVQINNDGLCLECAKHLKHPGFDRGKLTQKMEQRFSKLREESHIYDAVVCYSGGKDSSYLLYMLKKKYGLNPLAISVIHPFLNALSQENIESITQALKVDLIKFYLDREIVREFIRQVMFQSDELKIFEFFGCAACGYFHQIIPFKIAMKMRIPYVLSGFDPAQTQRLQIVDGEIVKSAFCNMGVHPFPMALTFRKIFGEKYRNSIYSFDLDEVRNDYFPTEIHPFSFIGYNYQDNVDMLEKSGIMQKKNLSSLITNCDLHHFFAYLSFIIYDCHPYERIFSTALRLGYPTFVDQFSADFTKSKLKRDSIIAFLEEYRDILFFLAENKELDKSKEEKLFEMAPLFVKITGREGFLYAIRGMQKIHEYSSFFDIDLHEI